MLIVLLLLATVLLAWANGANDNFKATATVYGAQVLSYRQSLALATLAQLAGSVASLFLAGALLKAFGGKGLLPDATVGNPAFLLAVGLGAAGTVLIATRFGLPISTTHALIGGLLGAGLALAPGRVAWGALSAKYALPLALSPLFALVATALIYPLARFTRHRLGLTESTCLCIGERVEPVVASPAGQLMFRSSGIALTIDERAQCVRRYEGSVLGVSAQRVVDALHVGSAFSLGFARGLNDTPKVLAILVAASWSGVEPRISLAIVAVAMAVGGLVHSRRLARTLGEKITDINHGQGLVANAVSSTMVIGASLLGSPVSTTHVSTGSIFGIGLWSGRRDATLIAGIVLAWICTLPIGAALAWLVATAAS